MNDLGSFDSFNHVFLPVTYMWPSHVFIVCGIYLYSADILFSVLVDTIRLIALTADEVERRVRACVARGQNRWEIRIVDRDGAN